MSAVQPEVCLAMLRSELSGYRGYPNSELGEKRFARALEESCISIGHLAAVLEVFRQDFPTVQEISDAAENLRAQFQIKADERIEWLRQYGPARRVDLEFSPASEPEFMRRDRAVKQFLIKKYGTGFQGFNRVSRADMVEAMAALQFPPEWHARYTG